MSVWERRISKQSVIYRYTWACCPITINCLGVCSLEADAETKFGVNMLLGPNFCEGKREAARLGRGVRCDKGPVIKTWPMQWRQFCRHCPGYPALGWNGKAVVPIGSPDGGCQMRQLYSGGRSGHEHSPQLGRRSSLHRDLGGAPQRGPHPPEFVTAQCA